MELHYYPQTDSLYISINKKASYEGEEVAPGVVFHFDKEGGIVSIDIDSNASKLVDLSRIELIGFPFGTGYKPLNRQECLFYTHAIHL